jgi:hypothetical protein
MFGGHVTIFAQDGRIRHVLGTCGYGTVFDPLDSLGGHGINDIGGTRRDARKWMLSIDLGTVGHSCLDQELT